MIKTKFLIFYIAIIQAQNCLSLFGNDLTRINIQEISKQSITSNQLMNFEILEKFQSYIQYQYPKEIQDQIIKLINICIENEINCPTSSSTFYHAQSKNWLFITEIITTLMGILNNNTFNQFKFLRIPSSLFNNDNFPLNEHLLDLGINKTCSCKYWDAQPRVYHVLLSLNISPVHNVFDVGESTLFYFFEQKKTSDFSIDSIINELSDWLANLDIALNKKYILEAHTAFNELFREISSGVLYQITIPNTILEKHAYLAQPAGRYACGHDHIATLPGSCLLDIINACKNNIGTSQLNAYQTRLRITLEGLLNPYSNIQIKQYVLPHQQSEFETATSKFRDLLIDLFFKYHK